MKKMTMKKVILTGVASLAALFATNVSAMGVGAAVRDLLQEVAPAAVNRADGIEWWPEFHDALPDMRGPIGDMPARDVGPPQAIADWLERSGPGSDRGLGGGAPHPHPWFPLLPPGPPGELPPGPPANLPPGPPAVIPPPAATVIPLPAPLLLLGSALAGLFAWSRRLAADRAGAAPPGPA
jgi:hypothetical protein